MIARALGWSTLSSILNLAVQVGLLAILSRLLGPADFGLVAAASLALRFMSYFAQFGLGPSLIQREVVEAGHYAAALLAAAGIGALCWIVFVALAAPFAAYFRESELRAILFALPASLMLGALAAVPQALLRRAMRFKAIAVVDFGGLVMGYGLVGIALAAAGWGAWSLVVATIAQQAVLLMLSMALWRQTPFVRSARRHFTDLAGYGARYSLVGFLDFVSSNVETLFIGRVLGKETLGIFNRVQAVTSLPVEHLMSAVNRVLLPAFAVFKTEKKRFVAVVLLSVQLCLLFTLPVAVGMGIAANDLVLAVLGQRWASAVPIVQVSVWAIPAVYSSALCGNALDAIAAFRAKTALIVFITILKLALMLLLVDAGLKGVAAAFVVAEWLRAFGLTTALRRRLGFSWRDMSACLALPLVLMTAVAAAVSLARWGAHGAEFGTLPSLAAQVLLGALAFFAVGRLCVRGIVEQLGAEPAIDVSLLRRIGGRRA